ncbi:hypothetical protein DER29_4835 [Micromonospora sp. M71_S20]|uniref:hypothetical protein n=1 Tax=Micromonospora sp. M71_S20 TaxID=592872 RepID=UPI000EADB590|nr:hypothetical protein [Micromonospora sp. M71_S20]RLK13806.1 hypothetical protein DER29_4835 [Micromonospora sp. M71_S20]
MAFRTWGRLLLTALGVSLLAGAGQLGIAFGFGIVRLSGTFTGATVNQWPAQLVWAGWFAANAAVVGAVLTERLARRDGGLAGTGRLLAVAGAAALGATVVAPLCMQPARAAELVSMDPVWAVGICAVLGALVGAGAALAVLLKPPVGWNVAAIVGAIWLLALVSVAPSLVSTGPLDTVRLGVLEPASLDAGAVQGLALVVLPLVALLAGAATGGLARWRGHPPLVSGATGVAGPVLVAFAYLTAGPGDTADRYQLTPYYAALLAVAAGALGSAAAALLRWPLVTRTAPTGAIEPTDILRPLPTGPALPRTPASTGDDEPETVDLANAAPVVANQAGGTGSGAVIAASGDGPAPRVVPPHWDWPADGGTVPAPAADARTGADPEWTAESPASAPGWTAESPASTPGDLPTVDRPLEPEPTPTQDSTDEHAPITSVAPAAPTVPATPVADEAPPAGKTTPDAQPAGKVVPAGVPTEGPAPAGKPTEEARPAGEPTERARPGAQPAAAATPAGQPAEAVAEQQAVPSAPKPRRTRKPRSTRQPAATVAPEAAGPTPDATGNPVTGPTAPVTAVSSPSPAAPDAPAALGTTTSTTAPGTTANTRPGPPAEAAPDTTTGPQSDATTGTGPHTTGLQPGPTAEAAPGITAGADHGASGSDGSGPRAVPLFAAGGEAAPRRAVEPDAGTTPPSAPAWPAPPRPQADGTAEAAQPATEPAPDATPRPRHRAPMPDLARAANWEALATARRGGPVPAPAEPAPENGIPAARAEAPSPGSPSPGSPSPAEAEQPTGRNRGRLGLFRRNRPRSEDASADRESEPLPAQDEEYVDWVTGLSKPVPDNEPEQESGRRSLRSTGRHHRD